MEHRQHGGQDGDELDHLAPQPEPLTKPADVAQERPEAEDLHHRQQTPQIPQAAGMEVEPMQTVHQRVVERCGGNLREQQQRKSGQKR